MKEMVNSPEHYNKGGIECIDGIRSAMSYEQFKGFLKGQVMKYIWRADYKGKEAEDFCKARWYLDYLIAEVNGHNTCKKAK